MADAQVAVVGSGVAGALIAWKLASQGVSVLLLEAGPAVDRAEAVAAWRRAPSLESPYPPVPSAPRPSLDRPDEFYVQSGPVPFTGLYERRVGGTTWHWLGTAMRFLPADFRLRSRHGVGLDWPLSFAELEPFYAEAERELGVSGGPGPLPALPLGVLEQRVAGAGFAVEVLPAARNSVPYDGRPACCGSGSCVPICPIGAKYDASVHVEKAVRAGARLLPSTRVDRLEIAEGRVVGLRAGERTYTAERYVVAAHALETARLLLFSGLRGEVGRNLMGAPAQVSRCLAAEPLFPFRSPQVLAGLARFREGRFRRHQAGFLTSLSSAGWLPPPELARQLARKGLFGVELRQAIAHHAERQLVLSSACEQLPHPDNRVTLDSQLDSAGLPRPRIHYSVDDYSRRGLGEAVLVHERIFEALGATQRDHLETSADPAHIMGTARMGKDPRHSVVDAGLRCHDLPNLFLVGTAVFPTGGSAPPTLTVAALALRAARDLRSR